MMHRALLVPDVLLEIFGFLQTPGLRGTRSGCFAALARTCKAFHEFAMNELWANIMNLDQLLGCVTRLHPIVYQKPVCYHWSSQGLEPLSEPETHQFLRHATRVRSIEITSDAHFHLLSVFPNETCLFPRLTSISFMLKYPVHYSHLFLSPMLRNCYQESIQPDFISMHLTVRSFGEGIADKLSLVSDGVRSCKRLVTLTCPPLDLAAWEHLSTLHTLIKIAIGREKKKVMSPKLDLSKNHNFNFTPFVNLVFLFFHSDTAVYLTTVLQHSEFPSLKEFCMDVGALSWMEAEQLFRALSLCKACHTLETIVVVCSGPEAHEPSANSLTTVSHILCFTQLRVLRLSLHHSIIINNDLLFEAISGWPHIVWLELVDREITPVTFRGIFAALRQCPHLQWLQISMDTVNIDIDPDTESFQHTALQQLILRPSDLADGEAVARIIFSMLPYVNRVLYSVYPELYSWQEVNGHLESLRSLPVTGRCITGAPSET
ncbi:hypothetical protein BD769DRAFT_1476847 [Suillus cothurnatus]|nr:hypothetical protein BD769DRAFT_1476847 [Suillus cothurnatus]